MVNTTNRINFKQKYLEYLDWLKKYLECLDCLKKYLECLQWLQNIENTSLID